MNLAFEYIKYRWNAKGRHGIHSPFVYDLLDKAFRKIPSKEFYERRRQLFKRLKSNRDEIEVVDFGAGSRYFGSKRKVSEIFKRSASKGRKGIILQQLISHFQSKEILEFGTSLGIGTYSLAFNHPFAKITTVEACPNTLVEAEKNFQFLGLENVLTVNSRFTDFLNEYSGPKFDFVFVDGHHDGHALITYLETLSVHTHDETIFVLDDIRWSESMKNAFDQLVHSEEYHVTIDLFQIAIIAKRSHQTKEHFVVKYF